MTESAQNGRCHGGDECVAPGTGSCKPLLTVEQQIAPQRGKPQLAGSRRSMERLTCGLGLVD